MTSCSGAMIWITSGRNTALSSSLASKTATWIPFAIRCAMNSKPASFPAISFKEIAGNDAGFEFMAQRMAKGIHVAVFEAREDDSAVFRPEVIQIIAPEQEVMQEPAISI